MRLDKWFGKLIKNIEFEPIRSMPKNGKSFGLVYLDYDGNIGIDLCATYDNNRDNVKGEFNIYSEEEGCYMDQRMTLLRWFKFDYSRINFLKELIKSKVNIQQISPIEVKSDLEQLKEESEPEIFE